MEGPKLVREFSLRHKKAKKKLILVGAKASKGHPEV